MRPPDQGNIPRALKQAKISWEKTNELWTDAVRDRFENQHWEPFVQQIEMLMAAQQELNQILSKAERDCRA